MPLQSLFKMLELVKLIVATVRSVYAGDFDKLVIAENIVNIIKRVIGLQESNKNFEDEVKKSLSAVMNRVSDNNLNFLRCLNIKTLNFKFIRNVSWNSKPFNLQTKLRSSSLFLLTNKLLFSLM
jgi:hypothetical protein